MNLDAVASICDLSALPVRWEAETGQAPEACVVASEVYEARANTHILYWIQRASSVCVHSFPSDHSSKRQGLLRNVAGKYPLGKACPTEKEGTQGRQREYLCTAMEMTRTVECFFFSTQP